MIADVLKGVREEFLYDTDVDKNKIINEIVRRLGDQFNADNPRFDFSRWEKWIFNQFPHIKERS
tara:strand:- start:202 stop:393 length:192 start_codon:yes stop_codon:yes gene_type:complete